MSAEKLVFNPLALRDAINILGQLAAVEHDHAKGALEDGYADSYGAATARATTYLQAQAMIRHKVMGMQRDHVGPMPGVGGY